jgi:hypothetical protein
MTRSYFDSVNMMLADQKICIFSTNCSIREVARVICSFLYTEMCLVIVAFILTRPYMVKKKIPFTQIELIEVFVLLLAGVQCDQVFGGSPWR